MIGTLLSIALGSAIGGVSRYLCTIFLVARSTHPATATMLINISGSFLAGVLVAVLPSFREHPFWSREFLIIGVLGGYTTFSAFSLQTVELIREDKIAPAVINVVGSVFFSLLAAWAGHKLTMLIANR